MVSKYKADHPWNPTTALWEIKKLQNDRRYRDKRHAFFVESVRNFVQLVDHDHDIVMIFYSEKLLINPLARKFVRRLRRSGIPTVGVPPEEFRKVSHSRRASGIGAIIQQRWLPLSLANPNQGLFWVIVSKIRSSGNFGTLIRTSEAIGGAGFILLNNSIDPFDEATIRASMSSFFCQSFVRTNNQELLKWRNNHNCNFIGASPDGSKNFHKFKFPPNSVLFLGEERHGLTDQQRAMCNHLVHIPMTGKADSLNLGVAGSLLMYEMFRLKTCHS